MLDRDGYRPNVGIILCNARNEVFWGKRVREHSWQFPQGGIKPGESPEAAMYRELMEEVGLSPHHVKILGRTRDWLRYDVPTHWIRREWRGSYRGQKQIWFLMKLLGHDWELNLRATDHSEFVKKCSPKDGWGLAGKPTKQHSFLPDRLWPPHGALNLLIVMEPGWPKKLACAEKI